MQTSNTFYYFGLCHYCKNDFQNLRRCSACKAMAYCSKEHQKLDWRNHKDLCKVIRFNSLANKKINDLSFEEWKNHCVNTQQKWTSLLNRSLQPHECQMWMFPRVCSLCYSETNLKDCSKCLNMTYCCNEHRDSHSHIHRKYCNALKLCMNVDQYLAKFKSYPQIDFNEIRNFNKDIPKDMNELLNVLDSTTINHIEDVAVINALKSEALSPGSLIFCILQQLPCIPYNNKCVIHFVGASAAEGTTDWILTTELLLHWMPHIFEVSYSLIGPEAWDVQENLELCSSCKINTKKVSVNVYKNLYHEVVTSLQKPSLVIALNCGLHEFQDQDCDEWKNSIPFLITNDVPFIFTSYTKEEMLKDLEYIKKITGIDLCVVQCGKNPFSSLRPIRDWCTKDIPVFYSNAYLTIIKKL